MKTVAEFIQRLQDDPAFEKQAQAFEHGDELIAFVKRQGYDFTLEQLMSEFEREEKLAAETGGLGPAPADASPSPPPRPDEAEFPGSPKPWPAEKALRPPWEPGTAALPRNHPWKGCRNQRRPCRRRRRKKSRGRGCLGGAAGGTGGSPPRD